MVFLGRMSLDLGVYMQLTCRVLNLLVPSLKRGTDFLTQRVTSMLAGVASLEIDFVMFTSAKKSSFNLYNQISDREDLQRRNVLAGVV